MLAEHPVRLGAVHAIIEKEPVDCTVRVACLPANVIGMPCARQHEYTSGQGEARGGEAGTFTVQNSVTSVLSTDLR